MTALFWDFQQPEQKLSNRPFYTKIVTAQPAAPVTLTVQHLTPGKTYRVEIHRTGFNANDAYSAYLTMGSPRDLSEAQIAQLNGVTRDVPEKSVKVPADRNGRLTLHVPMRTNDIVEVSLQALAD